MVFRSGLWLLLVICAGAYEYHSYDEALPQNFDEDITYHDDGYNDISFGIAPRREDPSQNLMMFKLINTLQKRSSNEVDLRNRSKLDASKRSLPIAIGASMSEDDPKVASLETRLPQVKPNVKPTKNKVATRYQPKWRIKRPPRLCLLKLCAPVYVYE